MEQLHAEVAVIGGGMGGCAAALALAEAGRGEPGPQWRPPAKRWSRTSA